jgi:uncharacterized protein (DUF486 family)
MRDGSLQRPTIATKLAGLDNTFMTIAWYGHLKYKKAPLIATILVSWGIAFLVFREPLRWNNVVSYVLLIGAVGFAFWRH